MSAHARLSPSGASRWMSCPGSIRLTEQLPPAERDQTSEFAHEGTLAHEVAEILASARIGRLDHDLTSERLDVWRRKVDTAGFDADEMMMHGHGWASRVHEYHRLGMVVDLERRVSTGVPQSWGTADMVAWEPYFVAIDDFKYGKGVTVYADDNPQLMLYGLGVLETFAPQAREVQMTIWQPRQDHVSTAVMSADDLRQWRTAVAEPAARLALTHDAPVMPSPVACQFCPVAGVCVARAESVTRGDFGQPELMNATELAASMDRLEELNDWISAVRKASHDVIRQGKELPGWKMVRKRGQRKISDIEAAIKILGQESVRTSIRPLGELEKLVGGKNALNEKLGDLISVVEGSEVLAPIDDPRPAIGFADEFDKLG